MKTKRFSLSKWILCYTFVVLYACTATDKPSSTIIATQTLPLLSTISTSDRVEPVSLPTADRSSKPTRIVSATLTQTATNVSTPMPEQVPTTTSTPGVTPTSTLLEGPLIAFRVQNGHSYLLLLDIGTLTLREVKQEHLEIGFLNWLDSGCHLYTRGNIIDLQGNIVEETNDPENGEAHFQVQFLSPDKKMGVRERFLGQQENVELEYVTLEILDRTNPDLLIPLAQNGGAYSYPAWSPDGKWLAFSDFDENAILQVYRATPDGQIIEQLTSHLDDPGVIQMIEWSPDGQHIAYAAQAFLPNQFARGGWIGLISLTDLRTVDIIPDHYMYTRGLWWSQDSSRIAFVGESLSVASDGSQIAQIHWADQNSGTILKSFYQDQAPTQAFSLAIPVGSLDTVFFAARDGYYLLDAATNTYEKILDDIPTDGLIRDFVTSPFDFPGEADCLSIHK